MIVVIAIILSTVVVFLIVIILMGIFFTIDTFLDLPYVATKRDKIETIIKLAQIKPKETVVDLGSGDGRLLFAAVRSGARAIGYEVNPFLVLLTQIKTRLFHPRGENSSHLGGVFVKRQNFWKADLAAADVIFVYGRAKTMPKFEDFVDKSAKRGTRIIVNTNPFSNKKPQKAENGIFLYRV